MISPCVCKIGFQFCALGDATVCYRFSLFPNTPDGRAAAKKVGGQVRPDENEFLAKMRAIRELAREKGKAA